MMGDSVGDMTSIETKTRSGLSGLDVSVITLYFTVIFGIGVWATKSIITWMKQNPDGGVKEYFLAAQGVTWVPIAGSIFATNVGATMFIGLSGAGAAEGYAPILYEWGMVFILPLLAYVFLPVYRASASYTMPEYLDKRYGGKRICLLYTAIMLFSLVLLNVAGEMYAAGLMMQMMLGWNIYWSILPILLMSMVYTVSGGLLAVIYTDLVQTIVLVVSGFILSSLALKQVGGFQGIYENFLTAASSTNKGGGCGFPPHNSFHIFRPVDSEYPWTGLTFGLAIIATFYFCNSQVIVQRSLAAKNLIHGKAGCIATMYLKILPFFMFLVPGMVGRILYKEQVGCSSKEECYKYCKNPSGCTNIVYPLLINRLMPSGLKGLQVASLLAANMLALSSIFNSASTMLSLDIWKRIRPQASDRELVFIGKLCVVAMTMTGVAWLPVLQRVQGSQFWDYMMHINSYTSPPLLAVFVLGVFWSGTTEKGAFYGLCSGLFVSLIRMIIHFSYSTPGCGEPDTRPEILTKVHYLHFTIISFSITCFMAVIVSFNTPKRTPNQLKKVLWKTRNSVLLPDWSSEESDVTLSNDLEPLTAMVTTMEKTTTKTPTTTQAFVKLIFGFPEAEGKRISSEEKRQHLVESSSISESAFWSKVCLFATLVCVVGVSMAIYSLA